MGEHTLLKKILIVDDSLTARRLLASHLVNFECEIIEAGDGNQGLEKLALHRDVALIFSDINMPVMNGLEMIRQIKSNSVWASIPICMLTTETGSQALQEAKDLGVDSFLVKPVHRDQVLAVVNGYLQS